MPNLPTGPYRLEVSLQGFRTYVQTGIVLQVGATPKINASLAVGQARGNRLGGGRGAACRRAERRDQRGRRERADRGAPAAGTSGHGPDRAGGRGGQTRARSQPQLAAEASTSRSPAGCVRRGVPPRRRHAQQPAGQRQLPLPFPDALQEFSVATGGLSAQNGMHSGASVNAVTKSGTNTLHGNAFEFLRDRRFNATSPFAPSDRTARRWMTGCSAISSAGRWADRSSRTGCFSSAATRARASPDARVEHRAGCPRPRCWPATSPPSPHPRATAAGRSRCGRRS